MNYQALYLLQCPECGHHPFSLFRYDASQTPVNQASAQKDENFCRTFCGFYQENLCAEVPHEKLKCKTCFESDIEKAVLFCSGCNRWYPVREGIISLMPDDLRDVDELHFFSKILDLLPERIKKHIENPRKHPVNNSTEVDTVVAEKRHEIKVRDIESQIYDSLYPDKKFRTELDTYLMLADPQPEVRILDLGCGTGRVTKEFLDGCSYMMALDYSLESLMYFKSRLKPKHLDKIDLIQGDISYLPVRQNSFDIILSMSVFCFLPSQLQRDNALRLAAGTLKEDGALVLSVYNLCMLKRLLGWLGLSSSGRKEGYQAGNVYYYNYNPGELIRWLSPYFDVKNLKGLDHRLPVIQKLSWWLNARLDKLISLIPFSVNMFAREMVVKAIKK